MTARNIHFGKSDVSFTLFRAVGEAHVKLALLFRVLAPFTGPFTGLAPFTVVSYFR